MAQPRSEVQVEDANGTLRTFQLARDDKGVLQYASHLLEPVHISVYAQSEEARYANLLPGVGSVYAQDQLSGGMGKKVQVRKEEVGFDHYYYADWFDASVRGQGQKGPAVTTLTAPANSGTLSGFFTLKSVPYLVLSRRIASWASDALTAVHDYGAGNAGAQAAIFSQLASEASVESQLVDSVASTLASSDDRLAQGFRLSGAGVRFLSSVVLKLIRVGTMTGDVRLSIMADLNGAPSMQIISSSSLLASQVPTTAGGTLMTFRFDDDDTVVLPFNVPFWLVLDCSGATAAITMGWQRDAANSYSRGAPFSSTDRGNTWTAITNDFYFNVKAKTDTTAAFVGTSTGGQPFKASTDGATFTADTYRYSQHFTVAGDRLVRSIQDGVASTAIGAIEWTLDGVNWNSDVITIGDPSIPITWLLTLGEIVIVCKQDSIFAVDVSVTPADITALYSSGASSTNGQGACVWKGTAYIPFNGRLMAVTGDFTAGFTVYESVGIEALREWDWPWGTGRHVACAATRHHLYSVVSSTSGYKLLKSADPLRKKTDGSPDPEWHGSLATIGDGSQTVSMLAAYDPGGSGSPQLFCTTTSNNIARIQLARTFNPAADTTGYSYDTSTTADLYFPVANGNYPVHPKSWLAESVTFQKKTSGDYVDCLWDSLDGQGWRRIVDKNGRLFDTGALAYPRGLTSGLLARRLQLTNSSSSASPLLLAHAVSYAMRHIKGAAMREITFSVIAEDGLSAPDLGEMLGIGARTERDLLALAAGSGTGTRRMEDPYGRVYDRVQFLDAKETIQQSGRDSGGRTVIEVSAVGIG